MLDLIVMDENDDVGQFLSRERDLLSQRCFLGGNHRGGVIPHLRRELKRVHHGSHGMSVQVRRVVTTDSVNGVAGDAALCDVQLFSATRVHLRHHQATHAWHGHNLALHHAALHHFAGLPRLALGLVPFVVMGNGDGRKQQACRRDQRQERLFPVHRDHDLISSFS